MPWVPQRNPGHQHGRQTDHPIPNSQPDNSDRKRGRGYPCRSRYSHAHSNAPVFNMHLDLGNTRQKTKTLTSSGKYNFTLPFEIHCCTKFLSTTFMSLMNPKENMLIHNMPIHYYYWAAQTIWTDVQHPMGHAPQQHRNDRTDPMTPPPPTPTHGA